MFVLITMEYILANPLKYTKKNINSQLLCTTLRFIVNSHYSLHFNSDT